MILPGLVAAESPEIPAVLLAPFVVLLLLIAVMPLSPARLKHGWEQNYPWVAVAFAGMVGGYYLLKVPSGGAILGHSLHEYVSFISLIGSLFVVAGGIHLRVEMTATPGRNVMFLVVGALLANVIGTTGASVVLIRPWIRLNQGRIKPYHVVFFIFVVSNVGGSLTPIGDPPLFLGYLRGVPFFWLAINLWKEWLATVALVLTVFYFIERRSAGISIQEPRRGRWFQLEGGLNVALLAVIVVAVFLPEDFFIREMAMVVAAVLSLRLTPAAIRQANDFNFGPIKEVAFLFLGIFVTMMPALNYLEANGAKFGFTKPTEYYLATGGLSAVLDNAPTYVNFLKLAETTFVEETSDEVREGGADYDRRAVASLLLTQPSIVVAISLGAVFFGAMTYIGNGPNFMVRSIAQSAGVPCPSFFGYVFKYSLPILLPILGLVGWIFL